MVFRSIELIEQSFIQSSSGWHAAITYKGKGYLSGAAHRYVANVSSHPAASPAHVIEGTWTDVAKFTKSHSAYNDKVFSDATSDKREVQVKPIAEQGDMESRKVWKDVADGIRSGDFEKAGAAKSKLENDQRTKRKNEQAEGSAYALKNFTPVADDEDCELSLFCRSKGNFD
jgi:hypothetical protein